MASAQSIIHREFLGWDQPALQEAARRLGVRYRKSGMLDLGHVIVVVPGQRAGRRLQELLAFFAEDDNLRFTPPEVITEGRLPEMLYTPKLPFASDLVQDLAWAKALRDLPSAKREWVLQYPPTDTETVRWLELGKMLRRLHVELAADSLDFPAVHTNGPKLGDFKEVERWEALAAVQRRYLELLDQQKLWDIQTARLKAIEFREIRTDCDIILLGTVDLTRTLRQMLDQIAARVTAYVVAPENVAHCFDGHGCLVPNEWCEAQIPFHDKQLHQVDGAAEQADGVTVWLEELGGRFRKDDIVIGVPDESLVPQLQRQLEQCGVRARWVEGVRLGETGPYRLLKVAVQFAGSRRYEELATLLRHPDIEGWLATVNPPPSGALSLPAQLDQFYNARLPNRVGSAEAIRNNEGWPALEPALKCINSWLDDASSSHPLRAWGDIFRKTLSAIYGNRTLNLEVPADMILHKTIRDILDECDRLATIPQQLDTVSLPAADAFQIALGPLADLFLPPPADPTAVEILGWLELPLDDAAALILTTFNEGFVPKSAEADAFLPDRLRRELGLLHNERRYARDAYATTVLCQSRKELRVLFARRDSANDPLQPSRLIFACPDDALVSRARKFFAGPKSEVSPRRLLLAPAGPIPNKSLFEVPLPIPSGKRRQHFSVTEFKDYLACPYRYYLRRIRKLKAVDDAMRELDGGAFGSLLHEVLGTFGRNPDGPRHSEREQEIFNFLADQLNTLAGKHYSPEQRRPAIRLQLEQARQRLQAFAAHQAELCRNGWHIVYAEENEQDTLRTDFPVDDDPIILVGRIDRIDYHESERKVLILDYKTADRAQSPQETHRDRDKWTDLQLPLYRYLWQLAVDLPADCQVEVAYFNLPRTLNDTRVVPAEWDEAMLAAADEEARRIVRAVRAEIFWPPADPAPKYSEDLAAICLDNERSKPALGDDANGDAS